MSVSWGTLREEDLIPAFLQELEKHDPKAVVKLTEAYELPYSMAGPLYGDAIEEWIEDNPEDATWLLEDLFDALNDVAPEGHYFGSHPGDATDFDFWPFEDTDW